MTYLTASEREQARDRVIAQLYRLPDSDAVTVPKTDLFAVLALTEQQPTINLLPAEPTEEQLRQFEAAMNDAIERGKVTVLTEQQSEPVSRREIFNLISSATDEAQNYITDELLSRYTITRKPQGADHG